MQITETGLRFNGALPPRASTRRIVVHHTASGDVSIETVHQWHRSHPNNWAGVGYHYLLRRNGVIERGRPEHMQGAHAPVANADGIGIALAGDFTSARPAPEQMQSLAWLIGDIRRRYGNIPVIGHKDVGATACPGTMFPWAELEKLLEAGSAGVGVGVTVLFNGRRTKIPAQIVDGRTQMQLDSQWVQLRSVIEMIPQATIDWDATTQTVDVIVPAKGV
ncbi:MAG: peptidoglycan recognition family protein [Bacillota bacterium]